MPFFSVVVPVYNGADTIVATINSVLSQSFTDVEVIIIDDGSTDATAAVIHEIKDERVRYHYQQNQERSKSRNNGMAMANGRYICLLDSDDLYYPNHLQALHTRIEETGFAVAAYKTMIAYGDKSRPEDLSYAYNESEPAAKYVWENGSLPTSVCVHRDIALSIPFSESHFCFEDIHWLIRVVFAYNLYQVRVYTAFYNNRNKLNFSGRFRETIDNCISCIRDLEQIHGHELKKILGENCFDVRVAETYLGVVNSAVAAGQLKTGREFLFKAIKIAITPKLAVKYLYYMYKLLKASL